MSPDEIREIIKPVGLSPMKSKGIHGLSKILIEKYNGKVPNDMEALEEFPAVGHKTASVVLAQAFGVPTFPVDTHIHRLMYRWNLSTGKNVQQPKKMPSDFFRKKSGTTCIYKLFGMVENILQPGAGTWIRYNNQYDWS